MSGYSIPYASDDSIKETVVGYYRASSAGGEVSPEKAAEGAEVSEDVVRRQRSFLEEIGILTEGESGFALTEVGQEIGRALRHNREDDAKRPFGEILGNWEGTGKIIDDLGNDYVSHDDVLDSIGFVTDNELDNYRQQAGANGLIDLFVWVGILEKNADGEYRVSEVGREPTKSRTPETPDDSFGKETEESVPKQASQHTSRGGNAPQISQGPPSFTDAPFNISLELTGDEDPKNVQKLIVAVRKGFETEIGDKDSEPETPSSDGGGGSDSDDDSSLDSFLDD